MALAAGLGFDPDELGQGDLVVDELWGQACTAFNIQADVLAASSALLSVQAALAEVVPGQRLVPIEALHLSILNLVHSRCSLTDRQKERLWAEHHPRWLAAIRGTAAATQPFVVRLDRIVLAPAGILIAATESSELVATRVRLAESLELQCDLPRLCHVTLLRFGPELPEIATLRSALRTLTCEIDIPIRELRTVRETRYPSLVLDVIQRDRLGAAVG